MEFQNALGCLGRLAAFRMQLMSVATSYQVLLSRYTRFLVCAHAHVNVCREMQLLYVHVHLRTHVCTYSRVCVWVWVCTHTCVQMLP